jgi:transglutaminase-like putative cysteine protease
MTATVAAPTTTTNPAATGPEAAGPSWAETIAQLALVAVHVGVAIGFDRLYAGSYLGPLVAFVVGAHALAALTRRLSVPTPLVAVAALAGAAVCATWFLFPATRAFGFLPTAATWHDAVASLRTARVAFGEVVAPTRPLVGFQLVAGLALSAAAWFGDWAAFRLRTSVEAVAPASVLFVFAALLGSGLHQWSATVWFLVPALVFVAAQRASRAGREGGWLASTPGGGPAAVLRSAAAVGAVAVLAAVVLGPHLPGASSEPAVTWRRHGSQDATRITVSPMVELRKRLVDQSDTEAFTVRTTRPAYWRLTSLDRFDGQIWSSGGSFRPAGDILPSAVARQGGDREITQSIRIRALAAIWVPVAYEATSLPSSSEPLQWDRDSGTLIVDRSRPSSNGLTYQAVSRVPEFSPAVLGSTTRTDDPAIVERYGSLPSGFPELAVQDARDATAGARNRYAQARALQDWFRSQFTYSLATPAGHSDNALVEFLKSREGYCEQFAGAYAAMARSLGIPTRVAVGFTPGTTDPTQPDTYHVLGRNAHAWPEVWFQGVGWVPFEPTPGRGIPDAQGYTGVAPAQDNGAAPTAPTTSTTVASSPSTTRAGVAPATATTAAPTTIAPAALTAATDGGTGPRTDRWAIGGALALTAAALAAFALAARRWRRNHRLPDHPVLRAWALALRPVARATGDRPVPAETHLEFARRVRARLGGAGAPLVGLAEAVSLSAWAPAAANRNQISDAERLSEQVRSELAEQVPPWWRRRGQASPADDSSSRRRRLRTRSDVSPK